MLRPSRSRSLSLQIVGIAGALATVAAPAFAEPAPAAVPAGEPKADQPIDHGYNAAILLIPAVLASKELAGVSFESGYRVNWLAPIFRVGFARNGFAPTTTDALQRRGRTFWELELDAQRQFWNRAVVALGAGAAVTADQIQNSTVTAGTWTTTSRDDVRVRPLLNLSLIGPIFEVALTVYPTANPEARFSVGISVGRHPRRR